MAKAPRSLEAIIQSIKDTHEDVDPTVDINKGPVSVLLYSFAAELARIEQHTSYLLSVYQLADADQLNSEDLVNLARNYGIDPDAGTNASVVITLYKYTRPEEGEVYRVDEGAQVGSLDGRLIFILQDEVELDGDFPELYYNADEQRYEVNVLATAVAAGTDYNVPAGIITSIIENITDFEGVVNNTEALGGQDPITNIQVRNIIWDKVQGLAPGLIGRLISDVNDLNPPAIDDISVVTSGDTEVFTRTKLINGRQAYDIYVISNSFIEGIQGDTALGGEQEIILERQPTVSVQNVIINGTSVGYDYVPDTNPATAGSAIGTDKVVLSTPLQPADLYEVRYYYYDLVYEASQLFTTATIPFGSNVLVRKGNPVQVYISATLAVASFADRSQVASEIREYTTDYFKDPSAPEIGRTRFISIVDPRDYEEAVTSNISGVVNFTVQNFVRMDKAISDVEIIEFDGRTEYPLVFPNFPIN